MTAPQHQQEESKDKDKVSTSDTFQRPSGDGDSSSNAPTGKLQPATETAVRDDEEEEGESSSTVSSTAGQGSGGYTADCSSDASSDLSGSAKKKEKDNMIVSVNKLSIKENKAEKDATIPKKGKGKADLKEKPSLDAPGAGDDPAKALKDKKKKKGNKRRSRAKAAASADSQQQQEETFDDDGDSDMADAKEDGAITAQWNGVQVIHPMDPRIDISRVGYLHRSPVAPAPVVNGGVQAQHNEAQSQDDAPSLENYVQLMEMVRPFFDSHGIGDKDTAPTASQQPIGEPAARAFTSFAHKARTADSASAGDSRASTSLTGTRSSSSNSSGSGRKASRRDAPLYMSNHASSQAAKFPKEALQLAARQKPLAGAALAEFYAPDDDPADEDDSDTSSMVVLARTKKKHKQQLLAAAEEAAGRGENPPLEADGNAGRAQGDANGDAMDEAQNDEDDRKPAARPQAPLNQELGNHQQDLEQAEEEAAQGNASSSSSAGDQILQGVPNQNRHNYDVSHVVTESASNTNTTTSGSGSGSGGNSGSNRGSSGSGNGSSGSGNGSSGSGNEGKGSSEDAATKEEHSGEGNSNSEDINSDDRKPVDEKEIAHPVAARRHGAGIAADGGAIDPMLLDMPTPPVHMELGVAARERKLQDKKRKRMNMRREYEEKVQQEMESSESSATRNAITLRPGRPVTLDKVLSFTKIARMVIQAGPPFLVVHTNAAYTRLTGIDAHAAVGKSVSALLSVQGPEKLSSSMNPDEGTSAEAAANAPGHDETTIEHGDARMHEVASQNLMDAFELDTITVANSNNGQRLGQSHAEAEEAGRARAAQASHTDQGKMNLERLVAACGFGKYHVLHARARPHHMVGRNVTFVNKSGSGGLPPSASSKVSAMRKQDGGSTDTSLTTNFEGTGSYDSLKCRSSISPILSDTLDSAVVTDNNQEPHGHKNKRRKHHHHGGADQQGPAQAPRLNNHHHRRASAGKDSAPPKRCLPVECVTHYAIQLEIFDDSQELNGGASSSSTSIEANLLGLTKAEVRQQRLAAQTGQQGTSQEESEQVRQQDDDDEMASETTEGTAPVTAVG